MPAAQIVMPDAHANLGYAVTVMLPEEEDARLRAWAESAPGTTWDSAGGHVTVVRLTGGRLTGQPAPATLLTSIRDACAALAPFDVRLSLPAREEYWDKPGLEIVMLIARAPADVAGIEALRAHVLAAFAGHDLELFEAGDYLPHLTLTTGLEPEDARDLTDAAIGLEVRFRVEEAHLWSGGERASSDDAPDPPWRLLGSVPLGTA